MSFLDIGVCSNCTDPEMCPLEIEVSHEDYLAASRVEGSTVADRLIADIRKSRVLTTFIDESRSVGCSYSDTELARLIKGE